MSSLRTPEASAEVLHHSMKDSHIKWIYFGMISAAASQFYFVIQLLAALLILSVLVVAVVIFLSALYLILSSLEKLVDKLI